MTHEVKKKSGEALLVKLVKIKKEKFSADRTVWS